MSFLSRMTRCPRPHDPDAAEEARGQVPGLAPELADLVAGAAGCSPYLAGLIAREAGWLVEALDDPEAARAGLMAAVRGLEDGALGSGLRGAKGRIALLAGLADLAGVWPLEEVTGTLTEFADLACQRALTEAVGREIRRGKLPGQSEDDIETAGGMVVLAMGKMGAGELNYSSDIDLICLFDETRFGPEEFLDARASFVRATRRMSATLNDRTAEGYVFRTDLRLRPDPSVTPVCLAMAAAEAYYESLGRTWERAAYIKARPCAGDLAAGERFLATLKPFVWRRHLDFAAIEDAHNMRLRIREAKGFGRGIGQFGHNMKLGRGGIREIEFFTQTRQIIAGGRDRALRVRGTEEGLARLAENEWIPADVAATLRDHYRFHREVEHRVQMLRDAQTHALPSSEEEFQRLADFMGRDLSDLRDEITARLTEVDAIIERFFAPDAPESVEETPPAQGIELDRTIIARWPTYPALRSTRATEIFNRLRPKILNRLACAAHPQEALVALDGFLAGLPAGVQLLSLFEANPQLIDLLLDIAGTAPALAAHLSRNAGVFDAVIAGDFFAPWPGMEALRAEASEMLAAESDYERKLDAARRWRREWHFRIGVHHLRDLIDADRAGEQYAELAEAIVSALYPEVVAQFATRHGPPPGRGAAVLGMGSLGGARLNSTSDLDLIVIYDAEGVESSDGKRPLGARTYYARLTQALITAITAQTAEGRLYEVDMRLRPSGNQGPVATAWAAFQEYQQNEAWVWEHLALTRARAIAGDAGLGRDVEAFRRELLAQAYPVDKVLAEVAEMRARIGAAKQPDGPLDTKLGPGRLQDVELIAQAAILMAGSGTCDVHQGLAEAVEIGWLSDAERQDLQSAFRLCWRVTLAARLLSDKAPDPDRVTGSAKAFLLRQVEAGDMAALIAALDHRAARAQEIIEAALQRAPEGRQG
ncbi:bifunctional [glutamine synthetase] adenylyltransferase/[glutamine synthetase]-adenylyl-L-tyrosine phosphorylase [Roseovarius sp. CH_XMU1461]|uniref:bifunctional [glutamine synthetase] adenylyltransferase/[glutamine synthetase]-adenylyl-L-tyrosine phosphorylase n=1 Tax=Roseovarius sp. CH_XMU1461 TaxID=3107777 RepID=UPI00300B1D0B